jgi:hypothetical protein
VETKSSRTAQCGDCATVLDEAAGVHAVEPRPPCPVCGSRRRAVALTLEASLQLRSQLRLKARRGGKGRAYVEQRVGDDLHWKSDIWNRLKRFVDRENDEYHELITNPETGVVIREIHEPLSQHQGHGAAKKRPEHIS